MRLLQSLSRVSEMNVWVLVLDEIEDNFVMNVCSSRKIAEGLMKHYKEEDKRLGNKYASYHIERHKVIEK